MPIANFNDLVLINEVYGLEKLAPENAAKGKTVWVMYETSISEVESNGYYYIKDQMFGNKFSFNNNAISVYTGNVPEKLYPNNKVLYQGKEWITLFVTTTQVSLRSPDSTLLATASIADITMPDGREVFGQRLLTKNKQDVIEPPSEGPIEI